MEDATSLYETNWSLFSIDGELLSSGLNNQPSEHWYQQDDLKKLAPGTFQGDAPDLVDQLLDIQQQISDDQVLDVNWLDTSANLYSLLSGEPVTTSESKAALGLTAGPQPSTESVQELLESLEKDSRESSVDKGIIDLNNGKHGSQSLLELLTGDPCPVMESGSSNDSNTIDEADLSVITTSMELSLGSPGEITSLSVEDVESIFSSNPSSPGESSDDSDPSWSPGGSDSYTNKLRTPAEPKSRSKYSEGDRKSRKKEQNRSAATRYRTKKKQEQDTVNDEYIQLEERNRELKEQVASISQEIKYLKDLMAEVYKVKKAKNSRCK